ncbi:MAG: type II secretion system F family protein [archaeon]|nr:type II secretion system F family protein [archaeon]MCP8314629.1 type II secretion system F family protein [archaeon]
MKKLKSKSDPLSSESKSEAIKISFTDRFKVFTFKLLRRPSIWVSNNMPQLREDIQKSNLVISPEVHISLVLFFTIIGMTLTFLGVYVIFAYRFIFGIFLLPIAPIVFALGLIVPKLSQSTRASAIDNELPFVIGYITTLAGGGISPLTTLERLSKVDLYPAVAKEAKRILMDIEVFGMDPISALDKAARYNPNRALSDFFGGYTSILKTGGDIVSYMESKLRDIFTYRAIKMKSAAELIGTFAEAYISIAVILGISFFVLFAVQALLGQGGGASLTGVVIFSVIFIPLVSALFIFMVHSIQPKEPFTFFKPYLAFSFSSIAIPLMFLMPQITFYTKLGLGLLIAVIPAAIVSHRDASQRKSVENMLPSFLRDVAEVRKTGLAPEKCIEQLANRRYGGLTNYVKTMSAQLSWGVPLRRVMINFSRSVRSWLVRAIAFLLLEVVDVGGGTVKMFGSLADFSQRMSEIEKEKRAALRPYIFIPYFGAVMVVVTTIMMFYFVTTPLAGSTTGFNVGVDIRLVTDTLLSSAILEAWIMGFVAGKMGEGSIAAGFKHAGALVIISLIAIYMTSVLF